MKQASNGKQNKQLGDWGEIIALDFLLGKGLSLISKNYRTPDGEIDLVMQQHQSLVFVEVKTRRCADAGFPEEAVTDEKLEHLAAAADWFLASKPQFEKDWRLDVIAVLGEPGNKTPQIEWFENVG